ncbi:hypothetical protein [Fibrobacter sp.]|uniref:hypothetical protein n=1 Tax=Fibrobacter sp. TaxID=35828 RepID=UPI00386E42D2
MKKKINVMNLVVATMIFLWMEIQGFFVHFQDIPYMYGQVELLYLIILNLVLLNVFELLPKISLVCSIMTMLLFPFTGGQFRVDGCSYYLVVEKIIWNIIGVRFVLPNDMTYFIAYSLVPAIIYSMYLLLFIFGAVAVFRKMKAKA